VSYKILGVVPWGGEKELPVLGGTVIAPGQHGEILFECVRLIKTAEVAAALPTYAKAEKMVNPPIPAAELDEGIRNMGGSYASNPKNSGIDVMIYACRVVDRLLAELKLRPAGKRDHGHATNWEKMRVTTHEVAADVAAAASKAGIHF
jgi:hypothetical protein